MDAKIINQKETGNRCLYVYYDRVLCDWEKRIVQACKFHNIERGSMTIICYPEPDRNE